MTAIVEAPIIVAMSKHEGFHGTTILTVRRGSSVVMGGDGQVTIGSTIFKADARKVRLLAGGVVLAGFAGAAADSLALLDRFEAKLSEFGGQLRRAAVELAKDWRTDRALRRLEAMLAVVDRDHSLVLSGSGEVIEPEDGIIGIGSGGSFAAAAAKALVRRCPDLSVREIVEESLQVASEICVYTNQRIVIEELS